LSRVAGRIHAGVARLEREPAEHASGATAGCDRRWETSGRGWPRTPIVLASGHVRLDDCLLLADHPPLPRGSVLRGRYDDKPGNSRRGDLATLAWALPRVTEVGRRACQPASEFHEEAHPRSLRSRSGGCGRARHMLMVVQALAYASGALPLFVLDGSTIVLGVGCVKLRRRLFPVPGARPENVIGLSTHRQLSRSLALVRDLVPGRRETHPVHDRSRGLALLTKELVRPASSAGPWNLSAFPFAPIRRAFDCRGRAAWSLFAFMLVIPHLRRAGAVIRTRRGYQSESRLAGRDPGTFVTHNRCESLRCSSPPPCNTLLLLRAARLSRFSYVLPVAALPLPLCRNWPQHAIPSGRRQHHPYHNSLTLIPSCSRQQQCGLRGLRRTLVQSLPGSRRLAPVSTVWLSAH
jgi:hypothetical protein